MQKETKKLQNLVVVSLNTIEKACKKMAKSFDVDYIPMNMYLAVLNKAKWDTNSKNQNANTYAEQYNLMLAALGKEASKDLHTSIDIKAISYMNRECKKSFNKGMKEVA